MVEIISVMRTTDFRPNNTPLKLLPLELYIRLTIHDTHHCEFLVLSMLSAKVNIIWTTRVAATGPLTRSFLCNNVIQHINPWQY